MTEFEIRVALADPEFKELVEGWMTIPGTTYLFKDIHERLRKKLIALDFLRRGESVGSSAFMAWVINNMEWELIL